MKNFTLFIILLCFSFCQEIKAQGFHFGSHISAVTSQMDGDKLKGFHRTGFSFGLIGGYTFNGHHYLIISPQYSQFGSKRKSERFSNEGNQIFVEMDISTINILTGYSYRFGDTWTGDKKYRVNAGLRLHRIINTSSNIIKSGFVGNIFIDEEMDLTKYFMTLDIGTGINLSPKIGLELNYNHSLKNILKNQKANVTRLSPYYLSLGLSYYFFS